MPHANPAKAAFAAAERQRRYRGRHHSDPEHRYRQHRANAEARDIPFLLTLRERLSKTVTGRRKVIIGGHATWVYP
jgi:hypothetical protein